MIATSRYNKSSGRNRAVRLGLPTVLLFLGAGVAAYAAAAPTPADLEKAAGLARQYRELKAQLAAANAAAETADPNLRRFQAARAKMNHWYEEDLAPQKQEYVKWRNAREHPQEADQMFARLKQLSSAIVCAQEMEDPSAVPFLRDTVLPMLLEHARDPNAVLGPYVQAGEKDRNVRWAGFQRATKEKADFARRRLEQVTRENALPEPIVRLAGDMVRGETYLMFYGMAIEERTPPEVRNLEQQRLALCRKLAELLPQWHALMNIADSENQKVLEQVKTELLNNNFFVEK
jgi:hypothetical protein